jgi:hypothetical protein
MLRATAVGASNVTEQVQLFMSRLCWEYWGPEGNTSPCIWAERYQRFGELICLNTQGVIPWAVTPCIPVDAQERFC